MHGSRLRITGKQRRPKEEGPEFPLAEWSSVEAADSEMRLDGFAEPGLGRSNLITKKNEGLSVWTAFSRRNENGRMVRFYVLEGAVRSW